MHIKLNGLQIFLILILLNVLILASAYYIEFGLGYDPCYLCLLERIIHFVVIGLSLIGICFLKTNSLKYFLWLIGLTYLVGMSISSYHFAVEQKWIETNLCSLHISPGLTFEEYQFQLQNKSYRTCSEPDFFLLGLSLTTWNILLNSFLAIVCFWLASKVKCLKAKKEPHAEER